ncbi:MAG: carboxypeptidase-like regulatory domain-containing protein [Chlorobi bacterium]|nr:carboxypeptidase-like regulatory domain-containing protein [Chlorobiota bacterium]
MTGTWKIGWLIGIGVSFMCWQNTIAQVKIQGHITNTKDEALSRINVLIYLPDSKSLIAFAVSDEKGDFQTDVNSPSDSLTIEVSSINHRNQSRNIANVSQNLDFELVHDVAQLETFTVKASPIKQKGDTISYLVSSFANEEDRAIEDVLQNMPGIEVEPNGKILYQGIPIQKFYVEGLDLMEGRYVVVSKNLPHGSVSTVEVLENHQPIRILEDKQASYQASLNLKLKPGITTTGTASVGSGLSPFLWDVNITPMTFTKKFQIVSSYQTNNTGNDVARQLKVYTFDEFLRNADRPSEKPEILNVQTASPPEIEQNRYIDNNIHLLNFNGLNHIGKDFQLRTNIFYINDIQKQQASVRRTYYTPTDTLEFTENMENRLHDNFLHTEFSLNRNVKKNYLNNELKIEARWDKGLGTVVTENENIGQTLDNPLKSISNDLRSVSQIGKHLVEFRSFISYDNSPHSLEVEPGRFDGVLNDGKAYEKTRQEINLNRFYADHSAGFVFSLKRISFSPRMGIAFRQQLMESNIIMTNDGEDRRIGGIFENQLEGNHTRAYLKTKIEYRKSGFTVKAKLPFSWQQVSLNDLLLEGGNQKLVRLFFDPRLSIDYKVNGFWRLRGSWGYTNKLGDIDRVYYGFILKNHRLLSQNAAPLSETSNQNFGVHVSYRNPITSFFNSFNYIFGTTKTNLMYSNIVQDNGTTVLQSFYLPNTAWSHNLQARTSKYFSGTRTTIGFRVNLNLRKGKSLMNDELFNTTNLFYLLAPDLNIRITSWLNSDYSLEANYIKTFVEQEKKSDIPIFRHKLNLFAFPAKNQLISIESEYYKLNYTNNIFVDILYRYTVTKRKIDIELRWNNIFNNKTYTSYQASDFIVWESTYILRPSQVFLSVKFSF